jgi:hypothetical protein
MSTRKRKLKAKGSLFKNPQQSRRTRKELESSLQRLGAEVFTKLAVITERLEKLSLTVKTIWDNQKELAKSETLLDEQFAVSTRMTILAVNDILERMSVEEKITPLDIETLFKNWARFRSRSDYRNFMMEWFMGVDIDSLPPPAESETKGEPDVQGSDGNEGAAERESQNSSPSQENNVPQVQEEDDTRESP